MLKMTAHRGPPVVLPSKTPERSSGSSASFRAVVMAFWPGARRASWARMKSRSSSSPAGTPSSTTPMAGPWDSPKMVYFMAVPPPSGR